MNAFDLVAKITLDSSEYDEGLGKAKTLAGSIGSGIGTALKVGAAAAGAAGVAFTKSAIDTGMQFDQAMSQVAATMGKTMSEMENEVGTADLAWGQFSGNLRQYAQEMGEHTKFTATEAAEALNYMALAGYDTQTAMKMLPNVLNLAAAGNFDLARASDMVTDTQTAFGISLDRTSLLVDEMAKAASTGNTSVEELGEAFLRVGGLTGELNGGMVRLADGTQKPVDGVQELEIALTAMANAGVKGSEAGTHMRNMIMKLSSPTSQGAKQFEALGVSVFDTNGRMKSLNDIFGDLSVSLGKLTQEQKIQAISDLFNTRDLASAEALLNAVSQDWNGIGESILVAQGSAQKMADTQLDNLAGDVTIMKSAFEGLQIAVSEKLSPHLRELVQLATEWLGKLTTKVKEGALDRAITKLKSGLDMLIPVVKDVIKFVGKMFEAWNSLPPEMQEFIIKAALVSAASGRIGIDFVNIGTSALKLVTNMSTLAVIFGKVSSSAGGISGVSSAFSGLAEIGTKVSSAFSAIGTAVGAVIKVLGGVGAVIGGSILAIKEFVDMWINGWDIIKTILEALGIAIAAVGAVILGAPAAVAAAVAGIIFAISQLAIVIHDNWDAIAQFFSNLAQGIGEGLSKAGEAIAEFVSKVGEKIGELVEHGKEAIGNFISGVAERAGELIEKGREVIKNFIDGVTERIKELLKHGRDVVGNFIQGIAERFGDTLSKGKELVAKVISGIKSQFGALISSGAEVVQRVLDGISTLIGNLVSKGVEIVTNVVSGIASMIGEVFQKGVEIISNVLDGIGSTIGQVVSKGLEIVISFVNGIASGFGDLVQSGIEIIQNVLKGFTSKIKDFVQHGKEIISNIIEGIKSRISETLEHGKEIIANIAQGIHNGFTSLRQKAGEIITTIRDGIIDKVNMARQWGKDLIDNFVNGIREGWDGLTGAISDVAGFIADHIGFSEPKKGPLSNFHTYAPDMMQLFTQGVKDNTKMLTDQIKESFDFGSLIKDQNYDIAMSATSASGYAGAGQAGYGGFTQNVTINSPQALDPSENARQLKIANQQMILALKGVY